MSKTTQCPDDKGNDENFIMENCKSARTPLPTGTNLALDTGSPLNENTPYRQLIGSLLHLANIVRPDISIAVGYLSRYMHKPTSQLWNSAKHVLRYLKGTANVGLFFRSGGDLKIETFSDADWAQERPTRKSISGNVLICAGGPISWTSKQQEVIAQSTKEAGFISLALCVKEVL